jgi:L-seryl-tRNA(Ser) seleniumtransferase
MLLAVHRGNFYMAGFVADPTVAELSAVAKGAGVPFMFDLGTGAVFDVLGQLEPSVPPTDEDAPPAEREPTPAELVSAGVDVVCFSGDKLLGGPQAGVLAGRADLIAAMRRDPLFRALRCGRLVLSALQATVDLHLSGRPDELPIVRMMRATTDQLRARADAMVAALDGIDVRVVAGRSQVGGGTMPRTQIPSVTLAVRPAAGSVDDLAAALRRGAVPVVGYIAGGRLRIDLRTVFPEQDAAVVKAVKAAAGGSTAQ